MQGVARQVQSGGQRKVKISILHAKGAAIIRAVGQISNQLRAFMVIAERWSISQRWAFLLTRLLRHWLGENGCRASRRRLRPCFQDDLAPSIPSQSRSRGQNQPPRAIPFPFLG